MEQEREVIREAWVLLRHPDPLDGQWTSRRDLFYADSVAWVGTDGRLGLPEKKGP